MVTVMKSLSCVMVRLLVWRYLLVMVVGNFGVFLWGCFCLFCVFLVWGLGFTFFGVFVKYLIGRE